MIDEDVRVIGSCSAMWNGDVYIFGGGTDKRQVNAKRKKGNCEIENATYNRTSLIIVAFRDWRALNSILILDLVEHSLQKTSR